MLTVVEWKGFVRLSRGIDLAPVQAMSCLGRLIALLSLLLLDFGYVWLQGTVPEVHVLLMLLLLLSFYL